MTEQTEEQFLAEYDPAKYPPLAVSVDTVALTILNGSLYVLGVKRTNHPHKGKWALPGAFPKSEEPLLAAAIRGLVNKTNVTPPHIEQLATYGDPRRDPRMRVVSVAYLAIGEFSDKPVAGYHAEEASWLSAFDTFEWAFDHARIAADGIRRAQSKMEYSPLVTRFLPHLFTMPQLRKAYEAVWNRHVDAGNFYRKVKATEGFVEETNIRNGSVKMYRAGSAKLLFPPIRREGGDWS